MESARKIAFEILMQMEREKAYSNLVLDQTLRRSRLSERDRSFITRLVYGTVERRLTLDTILSRFLEQPSARLKSAVRVQLRMAFYQLLFMEKIPAHAVLNESVTLTKQTGCAFAAGLMNAVLHKVAATPIDLEKEPDSVRYSCPEHLLRMWEKMYGYENVQGILKSINQPPPLFLRVNTLRTTESALLATLAEEGVAVKGTDLPNALRVEHSGCVTDKKAYRAGLFHVQDLASQLCVAALSAQPGEVVLDLCAAPGGKSFTLAQQMQNQGKLLAFDLYAHRLELIRRGAERLGIGNIIAQTGNALEFDNALPGADRVLCDVPCSGLGIIRRKPEIRYKDLDSIKELPAVQFQIVSNAARYVKPGGTLVYSTCALNKKENNQVCDRFLLEHPEFHAVPFLEGLPHGAADTPYFTLFPHINGTDGFFIAKFERST